MVRECMPATAGIYYSLYQGEAVDTLPVVLIHGAGGNHLYWPAEVRRLKGYRVYALDLPGHGKSEASGGQQTIGGYAQRVIEWLEAVGLPQAVFVGHSMGGAVAMMLGIQHPEQVIGMGLVASGMRLRVLPELLEDAASDSTFHKAVELLLGWSFSSGASPRLVELAGQRMHEVRPSVLYGDLLACNGFDVMGQVTCIHCPTLVMCGQEDRLTPLRHSQFLADKISTARLEVIPSAGHMVMLEKPALVAAALEAFLAGIPYNPGEAS